jgi:drug/metabolite transporter (DMT)-like permease
LALPPPPYYFSLPPYLTFPPLPPIQRYGSNTITLILNKYLLSIYGFKYPAFLTLCHMMACSLLSAALVASGRVTYQPIRSSSQLLKIASLAALFCLSVVLGNVSLSYIPVSFTQAIGATTPAFTAVLSFIIFAQSEHWKVYMSLIPIIVGIIIASHAEPLFHIIGFIAAVSATSARAMKSVLQGHLLADPQERMGSLSLLMYMAPMACVALIPATMYFEPDATRVAFELGRQGQFWILLAMNSFLAYFVNLTNFLVTRHTSALTLQVLGNAKGVVTVIASVAYFKNPVNAMTIGGYAITIAGVVMYSRAKKSGKRPIEVSPSLMMDVMDESARLLVGAETPRKEKTGRVKDTNV